MNPISKDQDAPIAGSFFYSFTNPVMENPVSTKIIEVLRHNILKKLNLKNTVSLVNLVNAALPG